MDTRAETQRRKERTKRQKEEPVNGPASGGRPSLVVSALRHCVSARVMVSPRYVSTGDDSVLVQFEIC